MRQLVVFHHEPAYTDAEIEEIHRDALRYSTDYNQIISTNKTDTTYPQRIELAFDGLQIEA